MRIKKELSLNYLILLFKVTLIGFLILFISGMLACNNKPANPTSPETKTETDSTYDFLRIKDETYIMSLDASTLAQIFNEGHAAGHDIKELHFEWQTKNKGYYLRVYGTAEKNSYPTKFYDITIVDTIPAVKNMKKLTRNPQSITRGELKSILGLKTGTNTPIDVKDLKTLYFKAGLDEHPRNIGKKYLYLFYSTDLNNLGVNLTGGGSGFTNPSPPKPPCDLDCDDSVN